MARKSSKSITPSPDVRALIKSLGGGDAVAKALNEIIPDSERTVDREAVYKWKEANNIPHYRRLYVARLACMKGEALPAQLVAYAPDQKASP